jgi:predicted nucleotidyltransferase
MSDDFHRNPYEGAAAVALVGMFKTDSRILAAYLHGSCVAGTERADSDLDCGLLLYPGFRITTLERMRMNGTASALLHRPVDIGILSPVSLVYFTRAVAGGYCLYCANKEICDMLVAHAFADYAQLREDRRAVEEAYRAA